MDALDTEDVFVFGLVGKKKTESFQLQSVAEHLCQVAFGCSGRAEEKHMGFCRQAQKQGVDGMVQFYEIHVKIVFKFFKALHTASPLGFITSPLNWNRA